jgi:hypothetical protein
MSFIESHIYCNSRFRLLLLGLGTLFMATAPARAIILFGTADPSANTSAPTGALAGSGWQYEGQFGDFLGTPIASNYFITAKHIGGSVGQTFIFDGITYTTTAVFPDPSSDLQIWQIAGTFPVHAPLYSGAAGSEVNLDLIVFGRGTQRGNPVYVGSDSHLGGWLWGASDGVQRWGTNVIGSVEDDSTYGELLRAPFDMNAGSNEAHLSVGDSGGGVFVFNVSTNTWELAGINLAVDGPFSASTSGMSPFNAAMFDTSDLFVQNDQGNWVTAPNPSGFYATEIAAHEGFIDSVVMQLVSSVSRKTHGNAGTFDINLPQTGTLGIECRTGGVNGDYTLVFTFANPLTSVGSASVTSGTGSVSSSSIGSDAHQYTVNLTGVTNAQYLTVSLTNVHDSAGNGSNAVLASMGVLVGDVNASRLVDGNDVSAVQNHTRQSLNNTNFRYDINASGLIDGNDVSITQGQTRTSLP